MNRDEIAEKVFERMNGLDFNEATAPEIFKMYLEKYPDAEKEEIFTLGLWIGYHSSKRRSRN